MKTVFSNSMCAHVWAQQSQEHGRSSGMSFNGPVIQSYQTPIAAFTKNVNGEPVVLITSHSYSVTTNGKHLNPVRQAVRHLLSFTVPDVGHSGGRASAAHNWPAVHEVNLTYLVQEYRDHVARELRSNNYMASSTPVLAAMLDAATRTVTDYAEAFGLELPQFDTYADAERISARRARLEAKRNAPGYGDKLTADREKRAAAKERKEAEAMAALREKNKGAVTAWLAGESVYLPYGARTMPDGSAMLRIRGDMLETSLGADAPLDHVRRAITLWQAVRNRGEAWAPNGHAVHLGHFTLDSIDAQGNVRAGCHYISRAEVERIAGVLGVQQ